MSTASLRENLAHVTVALREPEDFALQWDRGLQYSPGVWLALGATAALGTTVYGMTMGLGAGPAVIGQKALLLTLVAGVAWAVPLPALYILGSMAGSRLRASTVLLAALVTTSWGGLALLASVPINWFFTVAIAAQVPKLFSPSFAANVVLGINVLVFAGVGVSMADVFRRVMRSLEPESQSDPIWFLALIGAIGSQLFYVVGLFN